MDNSVILEVNDLKTYFNTNRGTVRAVDGVSFSLKKGETLGIVGESGGGKSVLSMSILRLIPKHIGKIVNGNIFFKGKDICKMSDRQMHSIRGNEISMIFQDPMSSLNPVFKVGKQIEEALKLHGKYSNKEAHKRSLELLREVDIPIPEQRINEFPYKYSGGMRQRAMIAMALACKPSILIADEPTTALDVTIQSQILRLMNRLKADYNSSIILVTHDLGVVAKMAKHVLIMYAGKPVEYGDIETIFYNSKHPYTWGLINSIPKMSSEKKELYSIKGNPISVIDVPKGCYFSTRCDFVMERCLEEIPPFEPISDGHKCACFLTEKQVADIKQKTIGRVNG